MPACTQAEKKLNDAQAKRRRAASSGTGGGAASDAANAQVLEDNITALVKDPFSF